MIAGVCGGLARYLGIDATLVRLAFVLFTLAGGSGVLIYIILLIVMPNGSQGDTVVQSTHHGEQQQRTALLVGGGLVLAGAWLLLGHIPGLAWISLHNLWPVLLIAVGIVMVRNYWQREN